MILVRKYVALIPIAKETECSKKENDEGLATKGKECILNRDARYEIVKQVTD